MCYFFRSPSWETIKSHYRVAAPQDLFTLAEYERDTLYMEGFARPNIAIITDIKPDVATVAKWGLVPGSAGENEDVFVKKYNTLNAKIETAEKLPTFRGVVNKRCLVPVESFIEWQWEEPGKTKCKKHKHMIKAKGRDVFSFAGLYNEYNGRTTFTVLTTAANALMAEIHNNKLRMPVILRREDEMRWLAKAPIQEFALPYQVELEAEKEDKQEPQGSLF